MTTLGILTAGGDCPGLNAVIRAVVRRAAVMGADVIGFEDGFAGFVADRSRELEPEACERIVGMGGSILGCSGARPFDTEEGIRAGLGVFESHGLHGLVVVGGNTSMGTALEADRAGIRIVGIPKTIDNDVAETHVTVGFSTAVDIATEAIDRLRTTAESHHRVMVVETMGRDVGWIAVTSGLAGGADLVLTPEEDIDIETVIGVLQADHRDGKRYSIVVVGEGCRFIGESAQTGQVVDEGGYLRLSGIGQRLADAIEDRTSYATRVTVIGRLQRGGPPNATDRLLATRFGVRATDTALNGEHGVMVASNGRDISLVPLDRVAGRIKPVDPELLELARAIRTRRDD